MNNKKIKVLHIANMKKGSGVASFLMNYFGHINRKKIIFYFFSYSDTTNNYHDDIVRLGGTVFVAPYYKHNLIKYIIYLNKIIKDESFDIIHCHEFVVSFLALIIAKNNNIKVRIIHSHSRSIDSPIRRIIVTLSHRLFKLFATDYFACSEEAGYFLFGFSCRPFIINNAIDINNFLFNEDARIHVRKKFNIADNYKIIGHIGRFSKIKNHIFLIKLFASILLKDKNYVLLLIGDGEKYQKIKTMAIKYKIYKNIIFYGPSDNVAELYSAMDVFVFPSLFEGLPLVGIEAQCSGLPVIASKGIPRSMQVSDLVTWLDLNDGADKWADEIIRILRQENRRQDMSKIITAARYSILTECGNLEKKYAELANTRECKDI
jgi:glycosyltransferase involved in cell wall biosynthesis